MEAVELFDRSCAEFDRRVAMIQPDHWSHFTPCSEWDVRALVNHVTVEDLWVPPLLAGATIDEVGDRFDGDRLGADPAAAWREAVEAARGAAQSLDSPDRTVHISAGDVPAHQYLVEVGADNLIHSWDLAIAIGDDPTLDPELVDVVAKWFVDQEDKFRSWGVIADRPPVTDDANSQSRLLAGYGRKA